MRILHIFDHSIPLHSGYSFRSLAILQHQRELGWETFHVTSPKHLKESPDIEEIDGYTFYRSEKQQGLPAKLPLLRELDLVSKTTKRILEAAEEVRPDILHAHSPVLNAMAGARAADQLKLPLVYEIRAFWEDAAAAHGTASEGSLRYRLTRYLEDRAMRRADGVTTICRGLKDDMIKRGIPPEKITVIPNAVDTARFSKAPEYDSELAKSLGLEGKTVLGFIGSFYDYEGLDIAIAAMPELLRGREDIRLLLVGGGPQDSSLKSQSNKLNLNKEIIFTGRVPHHEVGRYYGLVDVLVYPRKSMRLTDIVTPLKPLEAMAQHKMLAASDVGGHKELIVDGVTGTLFRSDRPDDLAAAVLSLLDKREAWPGRLKRARRFVEEERTWRRSVDNYIPLYQRLISGSQSF